MSIELKTLLKKMLIYDSVFGLILAMIIFILFGANLTFIFIVGLMIAVINFIISGIILEITINKMNLLSKILLPITYLIRIMIIILVAMLFIKELKTLSVFLIGFILHFPILIFSWFISQKGSE